MTDSSGLLGAALGDVGLVLVADTVDRVVSPRKKEKNRMVNYDNFYNMETPKKMKKFMSWGEPKW